MANTNGMRHPMTALKSGTFGNETIVEGRVFDALTPDTVRKLKAMGVAAVGDLTEHQDLSVSGLNTPSTTQVVNGRARADGDETAITASAPDGATEQNTGRPGLNNVPAVPELQKSTEQANADAAANVPVVAAALREGGGKDPAVIGEAAPAAAELVGRSPVEGVDQSGTEFRETDRGSVVETADQIAEREKTEADAKKDEGDGKKATAAKKETDEAPATAKRGAADSTGTDAEHPNRVTRTKGTGTTTGAAKS